VIAVGAAGNANKELTVFFLWESKRVSPQTVDLRSRAKCEKVKSRLTEPIDMPKLGDGRSVRVSRSFRIIEVRRNEMHKVLNDVML
jgi:hypothetical protein